MNLCERVSHTRTQLPKLSEKKNTHNEWETSILHTFCPRAQTNIFVRSGRGWTESRSERATERFPRLIFDSLDSTTTYLRLPTRGSNIWKEALDSTTTISYLHVEIIFGGRLLIDSTTISYTWKIFGGRLYLDSTTISYTWRILFGGKLLARLRMTSDFRQPQQSGALNEGNTLNLCRLITPIKYTYNFCYAFSATLSTYSCCN